MMKTKNAKLVAVIASAVMLCSSVYAAAPATNFVSAEPAAASDANYLKMTDGTIQFYDWQGYAALNKGGVYYDKYVEVADDEDLIIEYDYVSDLALGAQYLTIVKGLQKSDAGGGKVMVDASTALEAVSSRYTGGHCYTNLGAQFNDLWKNYSYADYDGSEALKTYLTTNLPGATDGKYYELPDGTVANNNGWSLGVDFHYQAAIKKQNFKFTGYTYKHVFSAAGGYECYQKPEGAQDSEYALILKTADTWGEDWYHKTLDAPNEKIFQHRSGYVGILMYSDNNSVNKQQMEIDNFKITVKGATENVLMNETYDRTTFKTAVADNWKYIAGGANTFNFDNKAYVTSETEAGAELRLAAEDGASRSGIRFTTTVNKQCADFLSASKADGSVKDVSYGTLITAKDLLGATEFTLAAMDAAEVFYYDVAASGFIAEESGNYVYKASLVNIKPENFYREWVARGYALVTYADNTTEYIYTEFDAQNSRSIYALACAAYADVVADGNAESVALVTAYLDGVVTLTAEGVYAGGVAGYTPAYSAELNGNLITVTSESPISAVVIDGVQVKAEITSDGGVYTAVYTLA